MIDIIKDYDSQPAFADFLPGIAGENGIPAWCFFVNRGQGVASFGTQDKDHPIMEFRPAHTAWQDVKTKGFRTFLKYHGHVSELFVNARDKQMLLGANSLTLQCRETDAPVRAQVQYFILPNACVGALARTLTIENTGNGVLDLEVLDGLPAIVPHGIGDWHLKCMTQTARAWMETVGGETGVPRYRVRQAWRIVPGSSQSPVLRLDFLVWRKENDCLSCGTRKPFLDRILPLSIRMDLRGWICRS